MTSPRVFIIRHGETEWSLNGRHTGTTELALTSNGEARIKATGKALIGDDRLIVPSRIAHIYVSPRRRAQRTLELLDLGSRERGDGHSNKSSSSMREAIRDNCRTQTTEDIREWDYGNYEGMTSAQIRKERAAQGLGEHWDIWRDGCPGGESPQQVTERLDRLIADIRARFHEASIGRKDAASQQSDVLLVAHGHILRAFAMRWVGQDLTSGVSLLLEAGGVGTLSYEHHSIAEPAIMLGGAFMSNLDA